MTTFIVHLFLPYTIDFEKKTPTRKPSPSPPQSRRGSAFHPVSGPLSLLADHATLSQSREHADGPSLLFPALSSTSPSLHFTEPQDPRSLARTDSFVPEWGHDSVFNQPRSKPNTFSPSTVQEYSHTHEQCPAKSLEPLNLPASSKQLSDGFTGNWTVVPAVQGNGSLKNAIRAAQDLKVLKEKWFVGTLGCPTDALGEMIKNDITDKLQDEFDACTVFVSDDDFLGHYKNFCKAILWPVFHYHIPDQPKSKAYENHSWVFYVRVNQAFAERIIQNYKHGDTIWIHDYHLMLVPEILRQKLPEARIGFVFHLPFPSSEIFRCLAQRRALLEGILGANLVVFQTQEYVQHFLQTCSHLLLVEATTHGIQLDDRFVNVSSVPIGIIPAQIRAARETPEVAEWTRTIEDKYQGKRLIVSRDKLESTRGIKQKLMAYELFLDEYPEWREKVVLIQVATATTAEETDLDMAISEAMNRIEEKYSTLTHQPVVLVKQDIKFSHYLALLTAADALLITSLRDGFNLTCHEYILCQDGKSASSTKKHGPLILSEFVGTAPLFAGAEYSINPWDYRQCAETIAKALNQADDSVLKEKRYKELIKIVLEHDGVHWVEQLAEHLEVALKSQQQRNTMSVPRLSIPQVSEQYRKSRHRFFVLNYEGTLASWGTPTQSALASPHRVAAVLMDLISTSDRNIVYVTSLRSPQELETIFGHVPKIGLIAENGCFLRPFSHSPAPEEWINLVDMHSSVRWKDNVRNFLEYYRERIEGSWIEERNCSLTFHYENIEGDGNLERAARQAGDCANHLNDSCQELGIRALHIDKAIVVELKDFSKTRATEKAWEMEKQRASPFASNISQFLMVAGDDREDEAVFRWANSLEPNGAVEHVITVCVGKKNATEAKFTLSQGATGLLSALQKLSHL